MAIFKEPACRALFLTAVLLHLAACAQASNFADKLVENLVSETPDDSTADEAKAGDATADEAKAGGSTVDEAKAGDTDASDTTSDTDASDTATEQTSSLTPATASIPAGPFIMGSTPDEREYAYQIDEAAYGHSRTRTGKWYDSEPDRKTVSTDAYEITITPVTNAQYAEFINATQHPAPDVSKGTWETYGLVHPYFRTRRHAWQRREPPTKRENHPVVMVSYEDANAYAKWLSETTNENWRLPTEAEWEKAVRGTDGRYFPWGNDFESANLNSHDAGPFDTTEVGTSSSTGPYGLKDGAGQVFEWIANPNTQATRSWVKGGSWDDSGCGVCRPAARHSRPKNLKHILVGFRLVKAQ